MAEFIWTESASTALSVKPRIAKTQFGDGYVQRAPDGLNPITQRWALSFSSIDIAAAQEIVDFFEARVTAVAGLEAFDWMPLWSTTGIRVICEEWNRTQDQNPNTNTVTAVFMQEHVA